MILFPCRIFFTDHHLLGYLKQVEDLRKAEILVKAVEISGDTATARRYLNGDLDADSVLKTGKDGLEAGERKLLAAYNGLNDDWKKAALDTVKGLSASFAKKGEALSVSEIA